MLLAFKDVVVRSEMFSHHHVARERLSVRERMSTILSTLERASFVEFAHLFKAEEGRMGVTVTFIAILELMREGLVEIVQAEPYAPIHLRSSAEKRNLRLVANNETPEQVAHAAELGETVLEEVAAAKLEEEAAALVADVDFVDDTEDDDLEAPIEDFGLDDIKVPKVDFGNAPPGWTPPPGVARTVVSIDDVDLDGGAGGEPDAETATGAPSVAAGDVEAEAATHVASGAAGELNVDEAMAAMAADAVVDPSVTVEVIDFSRLEAVSPSRSEFDDAGDDELDPSESRAHAQRHVDEGRDEAGSDDGADDDETPPQEGR